jgi:prolipoprotein diacylglyceryltransferase
MIAQFESVAILAFGLVFLLGSLFWLWMLIDCAVHEPSQGNEKIVWILIILLTHFLGATIYFFVRRPNRRARQESNASSA